MVENVTYYLMYKDYEVLSFRIDLKEVRAEQVEKLKHFDKAPPLIKEEKKPIEDSLCLFLSRRSIQRTRYDFEDIMRATGCENGLQLAFKGHGLSISNHYWYKREGEDLRYDDINFFTNGWDDSFGRAVVNRDYEALKHCDYNVPDVVTSGWGAKGWINEEDGPRLYKLGINKDHYEESLGEVLASHLASRLFNEGEYLKYELRKVGDLYASSAKAMISIDEELIPLSGYLNDQTYILYKRKAANKDAAPDFFNAVKKSDIPGIYEFFVKLSCLKDLCFVSDLHFENLSIIRNTNTGKIRMAPVYDLGGAFGSSRSGQSLIQSANKATLMMIYFMFSDLDESWDYSWYKKERLEGFEDEIREILSKSNFYTPTLIDNIIEVYHHQKAVLDEMAASSNK